MQFALFSCGTPYLVPLYDGARSGYDTRSVDGKQRICVMFVRSAKSARLERKFSEVLPLMMSAGSFLPLFLFLMDIPMLVVALEKVERSSGTLIGSSIATIQKSAAPEMLLALMDEAYTGSAIEDASGNAGSDDSGPLDPADLIFLDLLKDENYGIAVSSSSLKYMFSVLH